MNHLPDFPRYVSHKTVAAFKIEEVSSIGGGEHSFRLGGQGYEADVTDAWMKKHEPDEGVRGDGFIATDFIGGYFVVYEDGYASWSPADAFEKGYTAEAASITPESGPSPADELLREVLDVFKANKAGSSDEGKREAGMRLRITEHLAGKLVESLNGEPPAVALYENGKLKQTVGEPLIEHCYYRLTSLGTVGFA